MVKSKVNVASMLSKAHKVEQGIRQKNVAKAAVLTEVPVVARVGSYKWAMR